MTKRHIPTIDQIIDQITARLESPEPDQTETEALEAAMRPLEDYMTERDRMAVFIALAEVAIDLRDESGNRQTDHTQAVAAFRDGGGEGTR